MVDTATRISSATQICLAPGDVQSVNCIRQVPERTHFFDCFGATADPAIRDTQGRAPLTHEGLKAFLRGPGNLRARGIGRQDVVCVLVPNGPELAVALVACACQSIAAPLSPTSTEQELAEAFNQLGVRHALALLQPGTPAVNALERVCAQFKCELHLIQVASEGPAGEFVWATAPGCAGRPSEGPHWTASDDTALLLRTSGTTSRPKVVPLTPRGLHAGAVCIGSGLKLGEEDVCLNVMPLTHIGGISCSLLASLFAGSSVFCASGFDPAQFVEWLSSLRPTWYYAVPTIHKAVALYAGGLPGGKPPHNLRLIRSGAAHLSEADACELRRIFECCVLPTYSMSECMPVAQPPLDYNPLGKPGTVGVPLASSMRIVACGGGSAKPLPFGQSGEVCIRGPVVTLGYLDNAAANVDAFVAEAGEDGGKWFRTGDVGHLDRDGYLFLTGRSKELIKRGGEQVSPYEVEEALLAHASVQVAVAFGVPNDFWGEEVAAAVLLKPPHAKLGKPQAETVSELKRFVGARLPDAKVPRQVVVLDSAEDVPRTHTGKYVRTGLAQHLKLEAVDLAAAERLRHGAQREHAGGSVSARPHRAIYGVRYFFSMWVVFVHVGPTRPGWVGILKSYSASMPGFFMLAGFLLASSNTKLVKSKRSFYRNRIIAAYPLYLLALLYSLPFTFMVCPPGRDGISPEWGSGKEGACGMLNRGLPGQQDGEVLPGNYWVQIAYLLIVAIFGQVAWPWGAFTIMYFGFANFVIWFSSAYYFCLVCFPFLQRWLRSDFLFRGFADRPRWRQLLGWPLCPLWVLVTAGCYSLLMGIDALAEAISKMPIGEPWSKLASEMGLMTGYADPISWAAIFFLGMMTARAFELNRRGPVPQVWRHWGKVTDGISISLGLSLVIASALWLLDSEYGSSPFGGPKSAASVADTVGSIWSRPGRLLMGPLMLWLYGLATGQGLTARMMGSRILVTYLSPAAYSVYLFHFPTYMYWVILRGKVLGLPYEAAPTFSDSTFWIGALDYVVVLTSATLIAMVAAHKVNAPLTAAFMRAFDRALGCLCREAAAEDASTFERVAQAIEDLSGAEVQEDTPISECGLDSFGTSALLGVLRPMFPGLRLTPLETYGLANIGALAARIDADMAAAAEAAAEASCARAARDMRAP